MSKSGVLLLDKIGPQAAPILEAANIKVIDAKRPFGQDTEALKQFIQEHSALGELAAICLRGGTILPSSAMSFLRDFGVSLIVRFGSGFDNIVGKDDEFKVQAGEFGIVVENTPGQNANSVAELVKAFTLMLSRRIGLVIRKQVRGEAIAKADCKGTEVAGRIMGIIGLGWIGSLVARKALGLGMTVLGYDTKPEIEVEGVKRVSLAVLLTQADFISVHVPLTPDTEHLIGVHQIGEMNQRPYLINCARTGIVDLVAAAAGMAEGKIAGYASDVDDPASEIFKLPDTIVTPHIGASTDGSEERCAVMGARQVVAWLKTGAIQNGVNFTDDSVTGCKNGRLLVLHHNRLGVINSITDTVPGNIGVFSCKSHDGSGLACAMLGPDEAFGSELISRLSKLPNVILVLAIS